MFRKWNAPMLNLLMIFSNLVVVLHGFVDLNLSQENWYLQNDEFNISLHAKVPGSVHTTLITNHFIKDPYVGFRDTEYAWIADQYWTYQTTFEITDELFDHPYVRLVFMGLDTVARIYFNNDLLGKSRNMFTKYSFPVHGINKINTLKIVFESPTKYAKEQNELYIKQYGYDIPPVIAPPAQHGRDHPNFIRKAQCSFSWDWGPSFPTIGIWKSVHLQFTNSLFLDEVKITPRFKSGKWYVLFELICESYVKQEVEFSYGFNMYPSVNRKEKHLIDVGIQNVTFSPFTLDETSISRWWPTGYGNQNLYTAYVQLNDLGKGLLKKEVKFGFRTIELVEEEISGSPGLSYYFKINSQPIFLKGANWIPADSFQERVSEEVLVDLLYSTRAANMNALRVWGGGVYEQERFYELADELGIMISHDLMFAVALYPVNQEFLENVSNEVRYQIRRLYNHPSIIAWTGNNENEAAIAQTWWNEVKTNKDRLIADYGKLYAETIKPIVIREDTIRPFHLSSPSNGNENMSDRYIAKNPQDRRYGDVHFYNYNKDCWNPDTFPNPRFASEYGYQSYPSFESISSVVTSDDQLVWNSSLLFHRQHHLNGNREIEDFIGHHFELPRSSNTTKEYLHHMIYLSQVVQSLCVKYESEHYRRLQDNLVNGEGHTMGALYWQLNDIWQAPSWSSIEYGGRWKMLHYYVAKFFSPLAVSAYVSSGGFLNVFLVQDHLLNDKTKRKLVVNITLHSWEKFGVDWNDSVIVDQEAITKHSVQIYHKNLNSLPIKDSSFVMIQLVDGDVGDLVSDTEVFTANFSSRNIINPNLRIASVDVMSYSSFAIQIHCDSPAAFVWLETPLKGKFSENGFLMNTPFKVVMFDSDSKTTTSTTTAFDVKRSIQILSLYDVYATAVT